MRITFKLFLISLILTCFTSHKGWTQSSASFVINELLINPNNVGALPPLEFIELYPNLSATVHLRSARLQLNNSQVDLPHYKIQSNQYIILVPTESVNHFTRYGNATALRRWFALNNSSATIKLTQKGNILDENKYSESWYNCSLIRNAGWSLVCINPDWNIKLNWPARNPNEKGQLLKKLMHQNLAGTHGKIIWDGKTDIEQVSARAHYMSFTQIFKHNSKIENFKQPFVLMNSLTRH